MQLILLMPMHRQIFWPCVTTDNCIAFENEHRWERIEFAMLSMMVYFYKGFDAINDKILFLLRVIGKDQFHQDHDFELIFRCNPPEIVEYTHKLHLGPHKFLLNPNIDRLLHDFCKRNF